MACSLRGGASGAPVARPALVRDQAGGVALLFGLAMVPLCLALGLAVDGGLAYSAKSRLQAAVDAAVLAGGRSAAADPDTMIGDARMYFRANYPADFMGGRVTAFDAVYDGAARTVRVDAEAVVPTAFMRVAGIEEVTVRAAAAAVPAQTGLELALVLDVTGSMNRQDAAGEVKIDALKTAAGSLLDVIYRDRDVVDDVYMSVVPYNTEVNVGSARTGWLDGYDPAAFGAAGWAGCVEERAAPDDQSDAPPSAAPFTAFLWPASPASRHNPSGDPNAHCPSTPILPLTAERATIEDQIQGLVADGFTMTNVGLAWGWRTLSPRWQGEWDAAHEPVDADDPLIRKAVVFMTDGQADWGANYYTAYGFLADGRLGTTNEQAAEAEVNRRLLATCDAIKASGVEIYTVMFDLGDPDIEATYRRCASSPTHFFDAPTGAELNAAFRSIAGRLNSLRLVM